MLLMSSKDYGAESGRGWRLGPGRQPIL